MSALLKLAISPPILSELLLFCFTVLMISPTASSGRQDRGVLLPESNLGGLSPRAEMSPLHEWSPLPSVTKDSHI